MNTMIERMTKAMAPLAYGRDTREESAKVTSARAAAYAAAIQLRKPTESMISAGVHAAAGLQSSVAREQLDAIWRAMVEDMLLREDRPAASPLLNRRESVGHLEPCSPLDPALHGTPSPAATAPPERPSVFDNLHRQARKSWRWQWALPLALLPITILALDDAIRIQRAIGEAWWDRWTLFCFGLTLCGLGIRIITVGYASEASGHKPRTTGLYSIMRHPLHTGNFVALLGVSLAFGSWGYVLLASLGYLLYAKRDAALAELRLAAILRDAHDRRYMLCDEQTPSPTKPQLSPTELDEYERWAEQAPAFLPKFQNWRAPHEPFSWATAARRESRHLFAAVTFFVALQAFLDLAIGGENLFAWLATDWLWPALLVIGILCYFAFRLVGSRASSY